MFLLLTSSIFIVIGTSIYLRFRRIKNIKLDLGKKFLQKSGRSKELKNRSKKEEAELLLDSAQLLGVACYNFYTLYQYEKILQNSTEVLETATDELKQSIVFNALERRHSDLSTEEIIDKFHHHLSNKTLLKGDVGEEVGANLRIEQGFEVSFPTTADGSWKSNQQGYDYEVEKNGVVFKENPKVGYESNFDKIREQAELNPDVNYLTGTQHEEAILKSGLSNIESNPSLDTENILHHIEDFTQYSHAYSTASEQFIVSVEKLDGLDTFSPFLSFPLFSLVLNSASQYRLIANNDTTIGEAIVDTVTKTGVKWSGVLLGGMIGGPLGAVGGAFIASKFYTAFKSETLYRYYNKQIDILQRISQIAAEDLELKNSQIQRMKKRILFWYLKNPLQVIWPSSQYVIQRSTDLFIEKYECDLVSAKNEIINNVSLLRTLKESLVNLGIWGKLMGEQKEILEQVHSSSKKILLVIQKVNVIRTVKLEKEVLILLDEMDKIKKEERKLAA